MRVALATLVALLLVIPPTAMAQERTLSYSTSVEPETYVFDQSAFQRDADGNRVRDDDGRYKLEPQYITLRVEARMECALEPDGHQIAILADGPKVTLKNATTQEVESTYLDLEPREFNISWEQEGALGDWVASDVRQIEILSNAKPRTTIDGEFTWYVEQADIPEACRQDQQDPDVTPHLVIIPGFDFEPSDYNLTEDDLPGGKQTPAPGAALVLAGVGLVAALRRRSS